MVSTKRFCAHVSTYTEKVQLVDMNNLMILWLNALSVLSCTSIIDSRSKNHTYGQDSKQAYIK